MEEYVENMRKYEEI